MKTYYSKDVEMYMENDWIAKMLHDNTSVDEKLIRTDSWLVEMENKRMIYADVYGDLLTKGNYKVLDVGGGYTSLTKVLAQKNNYTLMDFLAHGGSEYIKTHKELNLNWIGEDWNGVNLTEDYDIIVANDIFPDVDQRLELFLDKFLPHCKELRLIVTYYNKPMFYTTKRIDDTEIMTFLSWDGEITGIKLSHYLKYMVNTTEQELLKMKNEKESIYRNGRQVAYIKFNGFLS